MTVYFSNPGQLDLDLVRIMGAHVKVTENPIGHFGTGLKYAIATLLRTGHKVTIRIGDQNYYFSTKPKEIRGKSFDMIYMNDEQLAFTLDLGKNWEPWQAYRELHSNTLDEGGVISDQMEVDDTMIIVQGDGIQKAFYDRGNIFLSTKNPDVETENYQIWKRPSKHLFYRGVRVYDPPQVTRLTYNRLLLGTLTEDRTFKSSHDYQFYLVWDIVYRITDEQIIEEVVTAKHEYWESKWDFSSCSTEPSTAFMNVMSRIKLGKGCNESAWRLFTRFAKQDEQKMVEIELDQSDDEIVRESISILRKMDVYIKRDDFKIVEHLGPGVIGRFTGKEVFITKQAIDMGAGTLAGTIFEEYCHSHLGYDDESRSFQNYLIDKLVGLARKL